MQPDDLAMITLPGRIMPAYRGGDDDYTIEYVEDGTDEESQRSLFPGRFAYTPMPTSLY